MPGLDPIGTSWGVLPINTRDYSNTNHTHEETGKIFKDILEKVDTNMYAVKYYQLIEATLISEGKIVPGQKNKNGIAIPEYTAE